MPASPVQFAATWTATDPDGNPITLGLFPLTGAVGIIYPEPDPEPEPVPVPTVVDLINAKSVVAKDGASTAVAGVDVPRLANQLIVYSKQDVYASVNRWGVDVVVAAATNTVVAIRDRERTGEPGFMTLLATERILSGHGAAAQWLRDHVKVADIVTAVASGTPVPDPVPVPVPVPTTGTNTCSIWMMLWPNSPRVDVANLPLEVDEIRLAFAINDGKLVGYGPYGGKANLVTLLKGFLAKRTGRRISISVGGGGYTISILSATAYVNNLLAIERDLGVPIGGLNWDWESNAFKANATKCIEVSRMLKALRGNGFYVSWSPNGTYKDDYRNALTGHDDVVDEIAQQFYDSVVSYDDALKEVKKYVALFGTSKVGVGMMVGSASVYWDLNECKDYMTRLRAETGVRITNLWEGSNPATAAWAVAMKAITA